MVTNILIMVLIVALAVLFFWLAARAGRIRQGWLRWPLRILAGLVGLVFAAAFVVAGIGYIKLNAPVSRPETAAVPVTASAELTAEGSKRIGLCTGCHSTQGALPLDGSAFNFLEGGPPIGVIYGPNLTPGGDLANWTDDEIARAIREGVDKDGRPLVIMPSLSFRTLSDEDVSALVAGLRAQPAVERDVPERSISPLGALMLGAGMFETSAQEPITGPVEEPQIGTPEYGRYITLAYGCQDCHGPNMDGVPALAMAPPGPDVVQIVKGWSEEDFLTLFREGKDPTGREISKEEMPWHEYKAALTEEELRSTYLYLHGK